MVEYSIVVQYFAETFTRKINFYRVYVLPHRDEGDTEQSGAGKLPTSCFKTSRSNSGTRITSFYANQFPKCLKIYFPLGLEQDYILLVALLK